MALLTDRRKSVASRWLDILLLAAVSLLLLWILQPLLDTAGGWLGRGLEPVITASPPEGGWRWGGIAVVLASSGLLLAAGWAALIKWAGFARYVPPFRAAYPPAWTAAVLAGGAAWLLSGQEGALTWWEGSLAILMILVAAAAGGWLFQVVRNGSTEVPHPQPSDSQRQEGVESPLDERAEFLDWLQSNDPIREAGRDYFNAGQLANQLIDTLRNPTVRAVTVKGPWGAGKSSVVQLIQGKLDLDANASDRILTCSVDTWGYAEAAAEKAVLEKAIQTVAEHVDGLGLVRLPQQYLDDMRGGMPWWVLLPIRIHGASRPDQRLVQIDRTLLAINARMIIFIEDVDRNFARQGGSERPFAEFEALLDRIRRHCDRITVVMVISESRFDFERVSDHLRQVPRLSRTQMKAIVDRFRQICKEEAERNGILLAPWWESWSEAIQHVVDNQRGFLLRGEQGERPDEFEEKAGRRSAADAATDLMRTPRRLKLVLSRTWEAWRRLRGEVLLDELLLLELIRHISPQTLDFMHEHATSLDVEAFAAQGKDQQQLWRRRTQRWLESVDDVGEQNQAPLWNLALQLFPNHFSFYTVGSRSILAREQGVYWHRIYDGQLEAGGVRDQTVLRAIHEWKRGIEDLPSMLVDENHAVVFDRHVTGGLTNVDLVKLDMAEILYLAEQVITTLCERDGRRAMGRHVALETLLATRPWDRITAKHYRRWLREQIERALNVSLRFALDIVITWGRHPNPERQSRLFEWMRLWVGRTDAWRLLEILSVSSRSHSFALLHLVMSENLPRDREWIVPQVEEGLSLKPAVMVPQACALFAEGGNEGVGPQGPVDPEPHHLNKSMTCRLLPDVKRRKRVFGLVREAANKVDGDQEWPSDVRRLVNEMLGEIEQWWADGFPYEPEEGDAEHPEQ